jgi:FkbM family methyltransferase
MMTDLIYDVGLHLGEDTDFYLKKGYRVIAFEADPDLINSCKARFSEAIAQGRLIIVEGAIGPTTMGQTITFYKSARSIWGTIKSDWNERNAKWGIEHKKIEVNRTDFAEILQKFGVPYYAKIDIEGADRCVLEALQAFDEKPRHISLEAEKVDYAELEADINILYDLGYRRFRAVQQSWIRGSEIVTEDLDGKKFRHQFEDNASGPFAEDVKQEWLGKEAILSEFKKIFRYYRLLGDGALVHEIVPMSRHAIYAASKIVGRPLAGWHDIHASMI